MASVSPYLNFAGTCADPALADQIMHITLPLGDSMLMGSDVPPEIGTVTTGRQFLGDYFGSCEDRFGITWMVDLADPEAAQKS